MPVLPPSPPDPGALADQRRRIRRQRQARAGFVAILFLGSLGSVWFLSSGEIATRSDWAFRLTQALDLSSEGFDGSGEVVCLVDTGIDPGHPDLARMPILGWRDFIRNRTAPYDDDGHGTAMAGLIAARGAMKGIAPGVSLLIAKALDSQGEGTSGGLAAAISFCSDPNGDGSATDAASIVSLSLAAASNVTIGSEVLIAVNAALARGTVVVASAGNDGLMDDGDVQNPASIPGVIAVGAIDEFGTIASFSSIGADAMRSDPNRKPEIVAPGVNLVTTARGGGYRLVSGTSVSAAFVSGILAILLQKHPTLSHSGSSAAILTIKTGLVQGAMSEPWQRTPHDPHYGYGIIRATATDAFLP